MCANMAVSSETLALFGSSPLPPSLQETLSLLEVTWQQTRSLAPLLELGCHMFDDTRLHWGL